MLLDFEDNRKIQSPYLEDVVNLCLRTDICKSLNMSFSDLFKLDLPTYEYLRDAINKDNEAKSRELEKSQRELENRQQQLLGAKNHVKRYQSR